MSMRALFVSAVLLAICAPSANAGVLDRYVPIYDARDGVTIAHTGNRIVLSFGPRAAKAYRELAGQKVTVGCGHPEKDDGSVAFFGGPDGSYSSAAGMTSTDVRFPRRRGRVSVRLPGRSDVCFVSARQRKGSECLPGSAADEQCVKFVLALTAQGRTDIDEGMRALELDLVFDRPLAELQREFGDQVVALDSPDASPPPGKIGIFKSEQSSAAVTLLGDGQRRFIRADGELYSTNVPALGGGGHLVSLF